MAKFFTALLLGLVLYVNLISARKNTLMHRENGFLCKKEGVNANPEKGNEFVICAKNGEGEFVGAIYSCPEGEEFDQKTMSCTKILSRRILRALPLCHPNCEDPEAQKKPTLPPTTTLPPPTTLPPSESADEGSQTEPPKEEKIDVCKNRTIHCSDCHTLTLCYEKGGEYQFLSDVPCGENDYCDDTTASCTSKIPSSCPADFACTEVGYLPDPLDCTKYYICYPSGEETIASTQYCAANQVYSLEQKMCVKKIRLSDCHTVKCPPGLAQYVVFPGDASYYAVCMHGKPEFVFHCDDGKEFDLSTKNCEVTCKAAGRMYDPDNCNRYYECTASWVGNKFTLTSHECPPGLGFNRNTLLCDGATAC